MLTPIYTKQFERDIKLMKKRGKNLEKLKPVIRSLILVYKLESDKIIFERTGTHSDLFQK